MNAGSTSEPGASSRGIAGNQKRTILRLLANLQPHWRRDAALPARIQSLLAGHREFGSRDRRLYRELTYTTLRYLPWIEPLLDAGAGDIRPRSADAGGMPALVVADPDEAIRRIAWLAAETPATRAFRAAFATGEPPSGDKTALLPGWFRAHCPELFEGAELDAQLRRAPLWLRLQTDNPGRVLAEFDARGWPWRRSTVLPAAVELLADADVTTTGSWRDGLLEVQDLGSQLILESIGIEPGGHWLDACAGAGGKTLQLAQLLGATGAIDAHDVRTAALAELRARAERAGLPVSTVPERRMERENTSAVSRSERRPSSSPASRARAAAIRILSAAPAPTFTYGGVLVDAPCSGSGTWRRAPHLKWTTTEAQIDAAARKQRALLDRFSAHVKPGGRLVYATCSLSVRENEQVIDAFLGAHPEFVPAPFAQSFDAVPRGAGLLFLPARHGTDGFFVASLRRASSP